MHYLTTAGELAGQIVNYLVSNENLTSIVLIGKLFRLKEGKNHELHI